MFNLRKKAIKAREDKSITIEKILLENPYHEWIREDKMLFRFFKAIFELLDKEDFEKLNQTKELCFLFSPGRYASTLPSSKNYNFIIIYPDLVKLINSVDNRQAFGIIFHELGHIINHHHESTKSSLLKQIEADNFAFKYGMHHEIQDFLLDQHRSFEVIKRLESLRTLLEKDHQDQ